MTMDRAYFASRLEFVHIFIDRDRTANDSRRDAFTSAVNCITFTG
jgi:hypothetical protein